MALTNNTPTYFRRNALQKHFIMEMPRKESFLFKFCIIHLNHCHVKHNLIFSSFEGKKITPGLYICGRYVKRLCYLMYRSLKGRRQRFGFHESLSFCHTRFNLIVVTAFEARTMCKTDFKRASADDWCEQRIQFKKLKLAAGISMFSV